MSNNSMEDILRQLRKHHGDEGIFAGNESMYTFSDVIPTGSYKLDDALGIWGIPQGHVVQYAGFESSGKTMLSLSTIAEWQKLDKRNWAYFVDAELAFSQSWAEDLGVDLSRLVVLRENNAVKIFETLVGQPNKKDPTKPKVKKGILDLEIENGGSGLGLIVIDSIAFMIPPGEDTSHVGKANMALMARFLPPELRRITPLLSKTGVSLICINQLRTQPGVMYGNPVHSPGGSALKFACAMMIHLAKINKKESLILESGEQVGHHVRARIDKNKKAPPHRVAEFGIKYFSGVAEKNIELRELGVKYGIINKPNNVTYEFDGRKFKGKDAIDSHLLDDTLHKDLIEGIKNKKFEMIENNTPISDVIEKAESEG